jgi:hypothetical protein
VNLIKPFLWFTHNLLGQISLLAKMPDNGEMLIIDKQVYILVV